MDNPNAELETQLRALLLLLDRALAEFAVDDAWIREELAHLNSGTWQDSLTRLFAETSQKIGLYRRYTKRQMMSEAGIPFEQGGVVPRQSAASLMVRRQVNAGAQEHWQSVSLTSGLPQSSEHQGVVISVESFSRSAARVRFGLRVDGHPVAPRNDHAEPPDIPVLTGVRFTDGQGTRYRLERPQHASSSRGKESDRTLISTLEFSPPLPAADIRVELSIAGILLAPYALFVATEMPVRVIDGPWLFGFDCTSQ